MEIQLTKMSSRGQVVIPQKLRDSLGVDEGSVFAVFGKGDSFILKSVLTPSKDDLIRELGDIAKDGAKRAKSLGIEEGDVSDIVHRFRKKKKAENENNS